ncbi:MAG: hypothetical protein K6E29_02510 [Cyanobacteria bacterium RUI128]|nr:hypothetical protein [Cyanobacteria bacterium RUI128]
MKIDAINFGAYTAPAPAENVKAEETNNTSIDEYDDTRMAKPLLNEPGVENPIERTNGTVEDLIALQQSTEKMAQSYGFPNVQAAQEATLPASSSTSTSAVSAVSSVSAGGINA